MHIGVFFGHESVGSLKPEVETIYIKLIDYCH